jgi:hypothetical protein
MNAPVRLRWELSGLEQMARMGGWAPGTVLIAMWGNFEESGEHDPVTGHLRRLTMGGFYAPWAAVEKLCIEWRKALNSESLGSLHLKKIASDEDNYLNWPLEKRQRLDRFVDILCEHATHFGAFSYPALNPRRAFVQAYKPGLARALIKLDELCAEHGETGRIVFARTHEIKASLIGRYFDQANWSKRFSGYAVLKAADEPALQAAEIVARGMKRFMQDGGITYSFAKIQLTHRPIMFWPHDPVGALSVHSHLAWGRK